MNKTEKQYTLSDQMGGCRLMKATSARQAVIKAYAISESPSLEPIYSTTKDVNTQVGYVVGQGHGNYPMWVNVRINYNPWENSK